MNQSRYVTYEFSGFRVDPVHRRLVRGNGQPVRLKAKAFDTLLYLIEHAHETVSKETLLEAIWSGVVVEENSLTHAISEVRHALGERPDEHRFILTEWGRGYRFVATVHHVGGHLGASLAEAGSTETPFADHGSSDADRGPGVLPGVARPTRIAPTALVLLVLLVVVGGYWLATTPRQQASIAVLPFDGLDSEGEGSVLVSALHDDILTRLTKLGALKVISRTSVMQYRGIEHDLPRIARDLGVSTVLEGTAQLEDGRIRLSVQLVDTQSGAILWSEAYEREPTVQNVVDIQLDIVRNIADQLDVIPSTDELVQLNEHPTTNSRAYEFYVSGRQYARGRDLLRDLPAAVLQYERAVAEDPNFALAWARLAVESIHMYWTMDHTDVRRASALAAAQRALELQPDLPEAHLAMAWYHYQGHLDYTAALREMSVAERGIPGDADLLFAKGAVLRRMGQFAQALTTWNRAIEIDPRNANLIRQHATTYTLLRDYARADGLLDRVLEIAPDAVEAKVAKAEILLSAHADDAAYLQAVVNNPMLRPGEEVVAKWLVAIRARDYDRALEYATSGASEVLGDLRNHYKLKSSLVGVTYILAGQRELARGHFEFARKHLEGQFGQRPDEPRLMIAMGETLVGLGERDAGIDLAFEAMRLMPRSREAFDGSVYQIDAILRILAPSGDVDRTLEQLDDYLSNPGFWSIEGLLPDPRLDSVRDDPRFEALVQKHKRRVQAGA